VLVTFLIAFAVLRVNGTPLQSMGVAYQPPFAMTALTLALGSLETRGVTAVVVNQRPFFSRGVTVGMYRAIALRYPHSRIVGPFDLRWRE
jgi:hypothetical protein